MSLVISYAGKVKPYKLPEHQDSIRRQRMAKVAPAFNDLLHRYLDKETLDKAESQAKNQEERSKQPQNSGVQKYAKQAEAPKRRAYARDIMSTSIKVLSPGHTLNDAIQLLGQYGFHHIPIVEDHIMKGIVSDRLILKSLAEGKNLQSKLEEIMVREVLTAQEHSPIGDIAKALLNEKISCLPVIDDRSNVKGIVTSSDLLNLLALSFPLEVYA